MRAPSMAPDRIGRRPILLAGSVGTSGTAWFWSVVLVTSLIATVALARAGSSVFWKPSEAALPSAPAIQRVELAAILLLLGYGLALVVYAGPLLGYARATAEQLGSPIDYVQAVLRAQPVPRLSGGGL